MSRQEFLLIYRPENEVIDKVQDYGEVVSEWGHGSEVELMFELDETLYNNQDLRKWLEEKTHTEYTDMVVHPSRPSEVAEWIQTDKTVYDRLTIDDLVPEYYTGVAEVIKSESPGGDIRKYANTLYGSQFSIDFNLFGSRKVNITGMDPFSMKSVERLVELGRVEDGLQKNTLPQYPPARRILEWASLVDDKWGLECGASGALHFDRGSDEQPIGGFDGFVIFDADERVRHWCDKRWMAVDSWSNRDQLDYPFMYPSEYSLYTTSEGWIPRDALRMWWD